MEVEVKIRLPSAEAHEKVRELFKRECSQYLGIYDQENTFLDGVDGELRAEKAAFRIRKQQHLNGKLQYFVTLKGKSKLRDGIHRAEEEEEELPFDIAEKILKEPNCVKDYASKNRVLELITSRFSCPRGWTTLGSFQTKREKFAWKSYTIELDKTTYSFDTAYEIELETEQPDAAKKLLESLLQEHQIEYKYSGRGKFANMLNQKID